MAKLNSFNNIFTYDPHTLNTYFFKDFRRIPDVLLQYIFKHYIKIEIIVIDIYDPSCVRCYLDYIDGFSKGLTGDYINPWVHDEYMYNGWEKGNKDAQIFMVRNHEKL